MTAPSPQMDIAEQHARLCTIIREKSFQEGGATKKLASGKTSSFYFDMKKTMSQPEALVLIADLLLARLSEEKCDFVGGLEMGAVPLVNAVALRSFQIGHPRPLFWVRKKPKDHGTQSLIEGVELSALSGKHAVMLEDVTTTGQSVMKAIAAVRDIGMKVEAVLTIVDRLEGARDNLAAEGIRLLCLYDTNDFKSG